MVALANISNKSIHPQEGSNKQNSPSSSFSPTSPRKYRHNWVIFGCIKKWFAAFCSSRDSASGDILVIDIF